MRDAFGVERVSKGLIDALKPIRRAGLAKDEFWHGTGHREAREIADSGFKLADPKNTNPNRRGLFETTSKGRPRSTGAYGAGVYASKDRDFARIYGPQVLRVKVKGKVLDGPVDRSDRPRRWIGTESSLATRKGYAGSTPREDITVIGNPKNVSVVPDRKELSPAGKVYIGAGAAGAGGAAVHQKRKKKVSKGIPSGRFPKGVPRKSKASQSLSAKLFMSPSTGPARRPLKPLGERLGFKPGGDDPIQKGLPSYLRNTPKGVLSPGLKLRVRQHESGKVMARGMSRAKQNPPTPKPFEKPRQLTLFERDGSTTYNARRRKKP
jgi:hypothetical protein